MLILGVAAFQVALVLAWLTWGIVVFLLLNSAANFAAPHPIERWVMGPITLTLVVLGSFVALRG